MPQIKKMVAKDKKGKREDREKTRTHEATSDRSKAMAVKMKKEQDELEGFLAKFDDPDAWRRLPTTTTMTKDSEDTTSVLTHEELEILGRLVEGRVADLAFDPYSPAVEFFTSIEQAGPVQGATSEPKRRMLPSKHEHRLVMRYVYAIKRGWITPKPSEGLSDTGRPGPREDLWPDAEAEARLREHHIVAPKLPLPGHRESYRPPLEHTASEDAVARHEAAMAAARRADRLYDASLRLKKYVPRQHAALRHVVAAYPFLVNERFARCLDLYLCPRVKKTRLAMDPTALLPRLPDARQLRPYPSQLVAQHFRDIERRQTAVVQGLALWPGTGQWLVAAERGGVVRVLDVLSGRCIQVLRYGAAQAQAHGCPRPSSGAAVLLDAASQSEDDESEDHVLDKTLVALNPVVPAILAVAHAGQLYLETVHFVSRAARSHANALLRAAYQAHRALLPQEKRKKYENENGNETENVHENENGNGHDVASKATRQGEKRAKNEKKSKGSMGGGGVWRLETTAHGDVRLCVDSQLHSIAALSWHRKGDYLLLAGRQADGHGTALVSTVHIYQLSSGRRELPFSRLPGGDAAAIVTASFHATRPWLLLLTRARFHVLDLTAAVLRASFDLASGASVKAPVAMALLPPRGVQASTMAGHVLLAGIDPSVAWYDLAVASAGRPLKTLNFHKAHATGIASVRALAFHPRYPLLASVGDDGCIQITHTSIPSSATFNKNDDDDDKEKKAEEEEEAQEPCIVPLKLCPAPLPLKHTPLSTSLLAVLFHPQLPWVFAAGEHIPPFLFVSTHY